MAAYGTALFLVLLVAPTTYPVEATDAPPITRDLLTAIKEMQRANYYTFSVLIKLSPPILFQGNLTFLMPNDRALSTSAIMPRTSVPKFLLLHSISSPLLFEHLQYLPTGSILPTSEPNFVVKVQNGGQRSFFLNNAHIVSPNICTAGSSSIRCHGIDNVLLPMHSGSALPSLPNCSVNPPTHGTPPSPVVVNAPPRLPAPMWQPPLPPVLGLNSTSPAHSNAPSVMSGTYQLLPVGYEGLVLAAVMFLVLGSTDLSVNL